MSVRPKRDNSPTDEMIDLTQELVEQATLLEGSRTDNYTRLSVDSFYPKIHLQLLCLMATSRNLARDNIRARANSEKDTVSGQRKQFTYNTVGQETSVIDALSYTSTFSYGTITPITIGGTISASRALTITVTNTSLPGGQEQLSYTTVSGNTASSIASTFSGKINADSNLAAIGVVGCLQRSNQRWSSGGHDLLNDNGWCYNNYCGLCNKCKCLASVRTISW